MLTRLADLFQIFLVIQFVLMFLFVPETTYIRADRYNTDTTGDGELDGAKRNLADDEKLNDPTKTDANHKEAIGEPGVTPRSGAPPKKTFSQELAVWTGVYSHDNIIKFLIGPFLTLLNPAACYAVIGSGLLNSWYVGSAIILSGILSGPPWLFNASQIGNFGFGPFIGGMIGSIITGVFADWTIKYCTRKNNGVYEPEFRLIWMAPTCVCCGFGMFFFGYTLDKGSPAALCAFLQGVMMVGVLMGIFSSLSYGLDAFRNQSNEIFIMNMLFKVSSRRENVVCRALT
jgi:hypothetical protein